MIPKVIHLCWFSDDSYPVEIKRCLASWQRVLPDFTIRRWTYADAEAIGCRYINEALAARKWAFAADAVRFYAIYKEGGVYMDSDMLVEKRFDAFIPEHGFASFNENMGTILLQAAFLIGEKGNTYCKDVFEYYNQRPFLLPDGSFDMKISPVVMVEIAQKRGYQAEDVEQHLGDDLVFYPSRFVSPSKKLKSREAFAHHQVYGSWRKHKWGRVVERFIKHMIVLVRFTLFKR